MGSAAGDCWVDGVFGYVSEGAEVVGCGVEVRFELAELGFHFVGGLPGAGDYFSDAAHGLTVAGHDGKSTEVVKAVFGGDRFRTDAGLGEGHVFGDFRVEVMAHHEHVEMLVDGVDGEWTGGIGG